MVCYGCGQYNQEHNRYCIHCGTYIGLHPGAAPAHVNTGAGSPPDSRLHQPPHFAAGKKKMWPWTLLGFLISFFLLTLLGLLLWGFFRKDTPKEAAAIGKGVYFGLLAKIALGFMIYGFVSNWMSFF